MKIRSLLLLFAMGIIVPLVLFGSALIAFTVYHEREAQDRAFTERTRAVVTAVDAALRGTGGMLTALAAHESLDTGDLKGFRAAASRVLSTQPGWITIVLNSVDGQQLMNLRSPESAPLPKVADTEAHRAALASDGPVVSGIRVGQVSARPGISVNLTVRRGGRPLYVLLAFVTPDAFEQILRAQKPSPDWVIALADTRKKFIARIPYLPPGSDTAPGFGAAIVGGTSEGHFHAYTVEGVASYQYFSRSQLTGWVVGMAVPAHEITGAVWRIAGTASAAALLALAIAFALAVSLSRRITRPMTHLTSVARRVGTDAPITAEDVGGIQELAEVSRALEDAVTTIKEKETKQRAAEDELREAKVSAERAKALAERANHAKDEFLAVLSHELRTPLTPVLAAVEIMRLKPGIGTEAQQLLDIIRRNVQLQARLIDDLLDLTRISQGKLELKRKPVEARTVVERAVEVAKPDIDARRLHFAVAVRDPHCWVNADPARLQQVVWNLLTNAVKFTPEGGCVGVRCECVDGRFIIEVSDSGIGIEADAAERIFDAFEQGSRSITRQFGGLGLGLAIARRLVEMHDGTISVQSEGRNRGSVFRVVLPVADPPSEAIQREDLGIPAGSTKKILLVEDNGDTAMTMKILLESFGYHVETAGDVKQALKAVHAEQFDLLISDLGLPDGSGVEIMQDIQRRGRMLKGIALSGYGQQDDIRRSKEAGFSAHLVKPVDADTLIQTVVSVAG